MRSISSAEGLFLRAGFIFFCCVSFARAQTDQLAEQSRRGKELMSQGKFEEAIPIYRSMVKAVPRNPGLMLNLGLAEQMAGHPDQAIPQFEVVVKLQPNNVPALTSLGMAHLQLNQPAQAVAPLKKVVALNPKDNDSRGMLAGAEMSLGKFLDAAVQYRELTAATPSDPKAWYGLGKSYESLADENFNQLVKASPKSAYVALLVGDSRLQRRQFRSAFFFYREAEKAVAGLPGLHAGLAKVYQETGHVDWAATEEKREAALSSPDCKTHSQACLFLQGKPLEATKLGIAREPANLFWAVRSYNLLAAQALDQLGQLPESPELHIIKAQILHDRRQDLEAAKEWRAAMALASGGNNPGLKMELATALFLGRDYQSAMPLLQELMTADPNSPDLNYMLGDSFSKTQQADKALPYLEKALQLSPEMLQAQASLGLALAALGRNEEAMAHLEKAASLDDDGSLHYSLARGYQALGNAEKARQSMAEYTKIKAGISQANNELATEAEITAPSTSPAP